jgi:hydrogenase nickel incorporation protein HypB
MTQPIYLRDIQTAAQAAAARVRRVAKDRGITLVGLFGQPGTGRTSLIAATAQGLRPAVRPAAITASPADHSDAEILAAKGIPTVSVEVGRDGRLDAAMVEQALDALAEYEPELVLIEQLGPQVGSPSLGESAAVVVVAAAGAQHLPAKYETTFAGCQAVVVNMMDLVALTDFRLKEFERTVRSVNAKAELIPVSCRTGEGLDTWRRWLEGYLISAS